jgi:hypothetical protein
MANLELVSVGKAAYGRHLVTARADGGSFSDLDPNAVFGVFTYQYSEAPPSQGRTFIAKSTCSRFCAVSSNAQFTLQPWDLPPSMVSIYLAQNTPVITIVTD